MGNLKILVVDDEGRMRKLVRDFLVKKDYIVLEAENGEKALEIFENEEDISLIILDIMMPKLDGWQVCKAIRKESKVPIIMLTAKAEEQDELLGFELGVDEYISKKELYDAVFQVVNHCNNIQKDTVIKMILLSLGYKKINDFLYSYIESSINFLLNSSNSLLIL